MVDSSNESHIAHDDFNNVYEPIFSSPTVPDYEMADIVPNFQPDCSNHHQPSAVCDDQSSEFMESYYENYSPVFDTLHMRGLVKYIAEKYCKDLSINEYLPNNCSCCLCRLSIKNDGQSGELCIKDHPFEVQCKSGQPKRKNNDQLKYQTRSVCDECMSSLTLKAKRIRTNGKVKELRCCFPSCSVTRKTLKALQNHYIKGHLKTTTYACNICEKGYCSKSALKKHEREKH